jgi:hypothetical protein
MADAPKLELLTSSAGDYASSKGLGLEYYELFELTSVPCEKLPSAEEHLRWLAKEKGCVVVTDKKIAAMGSKGYFGFFYHVPNTREYVVYGTGIKRKK